MRACLSFVLDLFFLPSFAVRSYNEMKYLNLSYLQLPMFIDIDAYLTISNVRQKSMVKWQQENNLTKFLLNSIIIIIIIN